MSWKRNARTVFGCFWLLFGTMLGAPMPPEKIRELLARMNQPKVAHVEVKRDDGGEP